MTTTGINTQVLSELSKSVIAELMASGVVAAPRQRKKRVDWERLLVYEYVNTFYPETPHWFRIEVGPMPEGKNDMLYTKIRRWADAIIHEPDKTIIIEGKMKANHDVVGQLLNYKNLFPQTPLFKKYADLPIEMRLVCAMIDDNVKRLVEEAGINIVIFKPSNFNDWLKMITERNNKK